MELLRGREARSRAVVVGEDAGPEAPKGLVRAIALLDEEGRLVRRGI